MVRSLLPTVALATQPSVSTERNSEMAPEVAAAVVGIAAALAAGASQMLHGCIGFRVSARRLQPREGMCSRAADGVTLWCVTSGL